MFGRGFRIATIRGVPVNVDSSWIWIAVLLVATFWARLDQQFPDIASGEAFSYALFGALVFFGSVFLHEAAHAIAARANGIEVHGITLVFFGGFTAARADAKGPGPAFAIAALGPGTSLALSGAFWLLSRLTEDTAGRCRVCSATWRPSTCSWRSSTRSRACRSTAVACCSRWCGA